MEISLDQLRELICASPAKTAADSPFRIGQAYLIRTVTNYWLGRVLNVGQQEITLGEASWIADTGRFHDCLVKGTLNEVEPSPSTVIVGRGSVVDAAEWPHKLPSEQK